MPAELEGYIHKEMAWFRAEIDLVWYILMNGKYPPKLTNNQKINIRRQKGDQYDKG